MLGAYLCCFVFSTSNQMCLVLKAKISCYGCPVQWISHVSAVATFMSLPGLSILNLYWMCPDKPPSSLNRLLVYINTSALYSSTYSQSSICLIAFSLYPAENSLENFSLSSSLSDQGFWTTLPMEESPGRSEILWCANDTIWKFLARQELIAILRQTWAFCNLKKYLSELLINFLAGKKVEETAKISTNKSGINF